MKLVRRALTASVAALALVLGLSWQASASDWIVIPPDGAGDSDTTNMALRLSSIVRLDSGGFTGTWEIALSCPRGEPFAVEIDLTQNRSPLVPPELFHEDGGVPAQGVAGGVCKGGSRR